MILDLQEEMNRTLTTEQVTMILEYAIQAAEDDGFINRYIYQRAMYVLAAIVLYPDRGEEIGNLIGANDDVRLAWDALLQDGTIEDMTKNFESDIDYLTNVGEDWYNDYCDYAHSARGILSIFNSFSGSILEEAYKQLQQVSNSEFIDIPKIAEDWGMNRGLDTPKDHTLHQFLEGVNGGAIEVPGGMPNFKLIERDN